VNARTGEYVAVGSGSTVVAFDLDGRRVASLAVTVLRVKRVTYIFGNNSFLNVGESRRVTVQLIDGQGNAVDPDEVLVRYRAEPTSVLRVDELGQVTGISTGKGIVTITAGGAQVKVAVQVESPGAS